MPYIKGIILSICALFQIVWGGDSVLNLKYNEIYKLDKLRKENSNDNERYGHC